MAPLRLLFGLLALLQMVYALATMGMQAWENRRVHLAQEDLIRLTRLTLRLFPDRNPPLGDAFWQSPELKDLRAPLDPWGQPYRLAKDSLERYMWVSAGPDGQFLSGDEIVRMVPSGVVHHFSAPPEEEKSGPTSTGAM